MAPPFSAPHIEDTIKRVRVSVAGKWIVDTTEAKLLWEHQYYPIYVFPHGAVSENYLRPAKGSNSEDTYDLVVGETIVENAVTKYPTQTGNSVIKDLAGLLKIKFEAADAWFEEDEQMFGHPKDPYKRCDVLQSSRKIRVELNGVVLAETTKPRMLFETLLPARTYIPKTDCNLELLQPSETTTFCSYKGIAQYYNVHLPDGSVTKDIVWWYRTPLEGVLAIKGYVAFYDEKVDVYYDGVKQPKAIKRA